MKEHENSKTASEAPAPISGPTTLTGQIRVVPWPDPLLEPFGHDPRSEYVERFWLAVLGPSSTWLLRRFASELERSPDGFTIDLVTAARSIGLGTRGGRHTPFLHSVERTCTFGLTRFVADDVLAVRRWVPPLNRSQEARLPPPLRAELASFEAAAPAAPDPAAVRDRANHLALSLVELGEDTESVERQLHRWRFHPALAHEATRWAQARHRLRSEPADDPDGPTSAPTPPPPAA